jgi:hypothetical protein
MIIKISVFAVNKTTLHHYEDQLVSAVYSGNNSKPTKALYGAKFSVTEVKESCTVHKYSASKDQTYSCMGNNS